MAFTNSSASPPSFLTPLPPAPPQASQEVLPVRAGHHPYFDLLYHPLRWDWICGRWLPSLRRLVHSHGVQNVDKDGSTALAFAVEGSQGWQKVPHDLPGIGDYLARYPAQEGFAHFFQWEKHRLLGGKLLTNNDEEGYADWLSKVCEYMRWTPDPDVVELRLDALKRELRRDEAAGLTDLRARLRAEEARALLDTMKAALNNEPVVEDAVTPSPRRKS